MLLPKDKLGAQRRISGLRMLARSDQDAARLAETILCLWIKLSYPHLAGRTPRSFKKFDRNPRVVEFATWLRGLEFFEAAFWLSSAYARWVDPVVRERRALFFTPPQLASRLLDDLEKQGASLVDHVWMDPACGGAAFLAPIAKRMTSALERKGKTAKEIVRHVERHVKGADVDRFLCKLSRHLVRIALEKEIKAANQEPKLSIINCDALTYFQGKRAQANVVACNPPYRKMTRPELGPVQKSHGDVLGGQPNIYALFFRTALSLLKPDGVAGLITPTSYLSGHSFGRLRKWLQQQCAIAQLDIVSDREGVFVGVEQETAVTVLGRRPDSISRETRVFVSNSRGRFISVGSCVLPAGEGVWPIPRTTRDAQTIKLVNGSPFRLEDYGYEPRVGSYVDYRERQTKRIYYKIPKHPGATLHPLIWSSDIWRGKVQVGRHKTQPRYIRVPEKQSSALLRRPSVALQRVTSTDQPRRLVGAVVPTTLQRRYGGVIGENHVVFLEQTSAKARVAPSMLKKVLQSDVIDSYFRCISGVVNVSAFELNQLPLPDPALLEGELSSGKDLEQALLLAFKRQHRK